jgi:hypothetical protein
MNWCIYIYTVLSLLEERALIEERGNHNVKKCNKIEAWGETDYQIM